MVLSVAIFLMNWIFHSFLLNLILAGGALWFIARTNTKLFESFLPAERKMLGLYPVVLFYAFMCIFLAMTWYRCHSWFKINIIPLFTCANATASCCTRSNNVGARIKEVIIQQNWISIIMFFDRGSRVLTGVNSMMAGTNFRWWKIIHTLLCSPICAGCMRYMLTAPRSHNNLVAMMHSILLRILNCVDVSVPFPAIRHWWLGGIAALG